MLKKYCVRGDRRSPNGLAGFRTGPLSLRKAKSEMAIHLDLGYTVSLHEIKEGEVLYPAIEIKTPITGKRLFGCGGGGVSFSQ